VDTPLTDGAFTAYVDVPLRIKVGETELELGLQRQHVAAARISEDPVSEPGQVELIPAGDDTLTLTWLGPESVRV
jgi:hypothetical protein